MEDQEIEKKKQKEIIPIMKENYDEYKFSEDAKESLLKQKKKNPKNSC